MHVRTHTRMQSHTFNYTYPPTHEQSYIYRHRYVDAHTQVDTSTNRQMSMPFDSLSQLEKKKKNKSFCQRQIVDLVIVLSRCNQLDRDVSQMLSNGVIILFVSKDDGNLLLLWE